LNDAYARLEKVNEGLNRLYSYRLSSGNLDPLPVLTENFESFDQILAWSRRVAAWLSAFNRRCHNYVLPLSVRRLAGAEWENGKETGKWKFPVGPDVFDENERHVRIRGMCAWCVGKEGPFTLDVWLPTASHVRYEEGPWTDLAQDVRRCRLGRVIKRETGSVPEVSGLTGLFNASPIGEWRVKVSNPTADLLEVPEDIQIDLYLSVLTI